MDVFDIENGWDKYIGTKKVIAQEQLLHDYQEGIKKCIKTILIEPQKTDKMRKIKNMVVFRALIIKFESLIIIIAH